MTPAETELLDVLTSESAWLHGLARRLARDPERAADAAQRTLLTALERQPEERGSLRAWLATVLRRALREEQRGDVRRADREALAEDPRRPPTPDETLARLDVQQRVVTAIRALDEPYRSTLVQRFLDGRSVREIARRGELPVKTVHTRVERGLARLRARLDREHGGDRSAWLGALGALRLDSIGPLTKGVGAMQAGTKTIGATVALVAVLGSTAWMLAGGDPPAEVELQGVAAAPPSAEVPLAPAAPEAPGVEHARSAAAPAEVSVAEPIATPVERRITGRVEDLDGFPVQDALVRFVDKSGAPPSTESDTTDARGRFSLPLEEREAYLTAELEGYTPLARPYVDPAAPTSDSDAVLVLLRAEPVSGRVIDEQANPVAGARVELHVPSSLFKQNTRGPWVFEHPSWEVRSDDQGAFHVAAAPATAGMFISAARDGYLPLLRELAHEERRAAELVMQGAASGEGMVGGIVLDELGLPVEGARVSAGRVSVLTDTGGRFLLELREPSDRVELRALRAGALPGEVTVAAEPDGFPFVTLQLGGPPLALGGVVRDEQGEPVAGAIVSLLDPTRFGEVQEEHGGMTVGIYRQVEELIAARSANGACRAETDAAGRFELDGLLPRMYQVIALDPRTLAGAGPLTAEAGRGDLNIGLTGHGERRAVAGRVVTRSGAPIAGVLLSVGRRVGGKRVDYRSPTAAETDAEGRFELEPFHVRDAYLVLGSVELTGPVQIELDAREDLESLELVAGVTCYARVEWDDPDFATALAFLDEHGEPLITGFEVPGAAFLGERVGVDAGHSGTLRTDDRARHLVLYRGTEEVYRCPVELTPGEETELRVP